MIWGRRAGGVAVLLLIGMGFEIGCSKQQSTTAVPPSAATSTDMITVSALHAGTPPPDTESDLYEPTSVEIAAGQVLFDRYNCSGCHANGGGGMAPPLIDATWIYGDRPEQIFATIVQGRPNGMPSFRGRIPDHQVWQLVAYARYLGDLTKNSLPGRRDQMGDSVTR